MISQSSSLHTDAAEIAFPAEIRIFFGHQSVGLNILDGIRHNCPNARNVAYDQLEVADHQYGIFHQKIGRNGDPRSKVAEFVKCLRNSTTRFDVALMKLCYADIDAETDVRGLFEDYQVAMQALSSAISGTKILHCTVPLRGVRLGVRSIVKKMMGHPVAAIEDNIRREAFNKLLREAYSECSHLFDIAAFESTSPDGSSYATRYRATRVPALDPQYSDDGGHLNREGQNYIASKFVQLINDVRC